MTIPHLPASRPPWFKRLIRSLFVSRKTRVQEAMGRHPAGKAPTRAEHEFIETEPIRTFNKNTNAGQHVQR